MNTRDDDGDLRERFEALRAADAELAPGFGPTHRPEPKPPVAARWVPFVVTAAAAAAVAGLWLKISSGTAPTTAREPAPAIALGQWTMPTDVLLDLSSLPGDGLLREVPDLGPLPSDVFDGARSRRTPTPNRRHKT